MNITISDTVSLTFNKGFWNIEYQAEVNKSHHLAKNDTRLMTENCGDLNRCITALTAYIGNGITTERYVELRKAYVQALRKFKESSSGDDYKFGHIIRWKVKQKDMEHSVTTNKNHHGFFLQYTYTTDHKKSDGYVHDEYTAVSHAKAAETMLNKTIAECEIDGTFENFVGMIDTYSSDISESMGNFEKM